MMLCESVATFILETKANVLILVLLDDALRVYAKEAVANQCLSVLILVLLDDALRDDSFENMLYECTVLILVLLDDALRAMKTNTEIMVSVPS